METVTHHIFTRMARSDHITLISSTHPKLPRTNTKMNGRLTYIRLPYRNGKSYIRRVVKVLQRRKFDLIQVDNRPTYLAALRQAFPRTPIVLNLHSLHYLSQLNRQQGRAALNKASGVTCVAGSLTSTFKQRFPSQAKKFTTIRLGVDAKKFWPRSQAFKTSIRKKYSVNGTINLLFVGRIIRRKGLHTLVKAAYQLRRKNKRIVIVAVGASWPGVKRETPYMRKVRRLAKRLGVPIRFTGYVNPSRVHRIYHLADVFVCPTLFKEGFACVNSEAMASGIPIVASARGGIKETVKHGQSGLLVKAYRSPQAFARAIQRIMSNRQLRRKLARGGRVHMVRQFTWNRTVRRVRANYQRLL